MTGMQIQIVSRSQEDTEKAGAQLGSALRERKRGATVCLYGDLGAGKTTFIKGVASAFGIPERDIGSASFVIVAEYETSPPFYHIDLYRIEGEEDLDAVGIWDYMDSQGIAVIEWAERLLEIPEDAIRVSIRFLDAHSREISVEAAQELLLNEEGTTAS